MKINPITHISPLFKGVREDRNTVSQLKENNNYSLTVPNQRRINKAIDNLAKERGEENIRFLLDVAENLKYQGHVPEKSLPSKNEWTERLRGATEESLAHSNPILREKYQPEIERVFSPKPLTKDEEEINTYKTRILTRAKKYEKIGEITKNLDYFITSSETPIEQKKYIMKRLDYFMSPKYKINPQLKGKKAQILHELANDIVINTPESKIPNTKAVNQKTHGMCAAISIARKAVAYEDKPNYIDAVLSELDASDTIKVYDRQNLGSGKRVPVKKIPIDFDYAQERGYRIVDASTLQWMNIANMYGVQNENLHNFSAFDKKHFDAFHDAFFAKSMDEPELATKQAYFQALTKAKSDIGATKSKGIKTDIQNTKNRQNYEKNIRALKANNNDLREYVSQIIPNANKETRTAIMKDLERLAQPISSKIEKLPEDLRKYAFIPNEEASQKQKKIEAYFNEQFGAQNVNKNVLSGKSLLIVDTLEDIARIDKEINPNVSKASKIARARSLYEAEAIYRTSIEIGLQDKDNKNDALITYNIPDRETRIVDGYNKVINSIEKKNDKKLMEHFATYLETTPDNKAEIVKGLKDLRNTVQFLLTDGLDMVYKSLGFGGKSAVLANDIKDCIESIENGDKNELKRTAASMHVKEDKTTVLKGLNDLSKALETNPSDQKAYIEAFNKMGYKDQTEVFIDLCGIFANVLSSEDDLQKGIILNNFKKANDLPEDANEKEINNKLIEISNQFNGISQTLAIAAAMLEVPNDDGTPYFTINEGSIITKRMEKEGKLIPVKTMMKLQERFAKIDKIRSSDEFSSRQGNISDPTLYKLTEEEKQGVKSIENNLNFIYGDVIRRLNYQYREIRKPLEALARYIGTNSGDYWVLADGQSGLFHAQEAKIFEQLTDRPYYEIEDIQKASELIKKGTHSGISGSSVFHDRSGGHAQYVADVVKDDTTGKDILFHDNTWGASEHENTWIGSDGHLRTDYSDRRGGETGYITNDDWRNGNFVDDLVYKKGTISPDRTESRTYHHINPSSKDGHDFSLMSAIILEGINPAYRDVAAILKDELFISDANQIPTLEKQASSMTKLEIQKAIFKNKTIGDAYKKQYDRIIKQITPTTFNNGIRNEADYNALPDNSPVKVAFEKAAIRNRFEDASMYKELAGLKDVKDINKVKEQQRKLAYKDFQYPFYKGGLSSDVLYSSAVNHGTDLTMTLYTPLEKHNVKFSIDDLTKVLKDATKLQKDEGNLYNGSLKNSIDIITNRISKQFDEVISATDESKLAKEEFMTNLKNFYDKNVYFNEEDLKADTVKTRAIRQWIDDKFNPKTDEEFVEIYRNIQDMTNDEFAKLTRNIDDKYLGISNTTGYDILRKVLAANDSAESSLRNVLFYDEYSKDLNLSKTKPHYRNKKLERNQRGASYVGERTFDDLYRTMSMSLNQLEYPKMFNKYKDRNYRVSGAMPAYPKLDLGEDEVLNEKIQMTENLVQETFDTLNTQKNCIYNINLANMLNDYRNSIPTNRNLTAAEETTIKTLVNKFIDANVTDSNFETVLDAAYNIMETNKSGTIADYNDNIDVIVSTMKMVEAVNTIDDYKNSNIENSKAINRYINMTIDTNIPSKYRKILKEDAKQWFNLELGLRNNENGLDMNKDMLVLQTNILKNTKTNDNKALLEEFTEIYNALSAAKESNTASKKSKEAINYQLRNLNDMSNRFLDKFVTEESKNGLRANMNDWFRKELVGGKKKQVRIEDVDKAREQFFSDYKKHHITSHPSEILEDYLLSVAKDAEPRQEKAVYKKYLETELNLAKFVAIQDALMDAVQAGNASQVKNYFDDFYVDPYNNGNIVNMNSDTAIDYMIRSLLLDNNTETAKMFVEKLGLGERVIDIETRIIKQLKTREKIDNIVKTLTESTAHAVIVKTEFDKLLKVINSADDVDSAINKTKYALAKQTKDYKDKASKKIIYSALEAGREAIKQNPNVSRSAIMAKLMNEALEAANNSISEKVQEEQSYIEIANTIYNFLLSIQFPEKSKGERMQAKVAKEQQTLNDYVNASFLKLSQDNPNIVITKK